MNAVKRAAPLAAVIAAAALLIFWPAGCSRTQPSPPVSGPAGWRGDGTGRFPDANPPTEWDGDTRKGVLWSVEVGKCRYSSPIVAGDRVFVACEPDLMVCIDAASGKKLWEKATTFDDLPTEIEPKPIHPETGNVSPTPVSDGKFVYMVFGNSLVTCFDMDGNRKWIGYIEDPCPTVYGRSASPVLCGGKLIAAMNCLRAFDATTGKEVWKNVEIDEGYGSPVAAKIGGVDVIVAPGGQIVQASDGKLLLAEGMNSLTYASLSVVDGVAYGLDSTSYAARLPDKIAEPLAIKKLWGQDLDDDFFSSGVVHDGLVYAANNKGQLYVLDAADGRIVYQKALDIPNDSGAEGVAPGNIYPSISLAGKFIYVSNDKGDTLVLQPGKEYKEIAHNRLNDGSGATPFFAGKRIYVRGEETLYCLGQ